MDYGLYGFTIVISGSTSNTISGMSNRVYNTNENLDTKVYDDIGYNNFVKHYANLLKDDIDAIIIGSEMKGLTGIYDKSRDDYPAVDEFCNLADEIRNIVGNDVKITYAADWSEYHHDQLGDYNLDKLWANKNIDFIGIDAYFPLSDSLNTVIGATELIAKTGGTVAIICTMLIVSIPILKIVVIIGMYSFICGLSQPIESKYITDLIDYFSKVYKDILGIIIGECIIFISSIGIIMHMLNSL